MKVLIAKAVILALFFSGSAALLSRKPPALQGTAAQQTTAKTSKPSRPMQAKR